jgi:hypothetical protein
MTVAHSDIPPVVTATVAAVEVSSRGLYGLIIPDIAVYLLDKLT